jgi:hypothetical protein
MQATAHEASGVIYRDIPSDGICYSASRNQNLLTIRYLT